MGLHVLRRGMQVSVLGAHCMSAPQAVQRELKSEKHQRERAATATKVLQSEKASLQAQQAALQAHKASLQASRFAHKTFMRHA
jgi:chromosome segregation ATPase